MGNGHELIRNRLLKFEEIDSAMIKWIKVIRSKNVPISGIEMKARALEYANIFNDGELQATSLKLVMAGSRNLKKDMYCEHLIVFIKYVGIVLISHILARL